MASNMTALISGLADGINQYMNLKHESELETQKQQVLQQSELQRQEQLAKYKQGMEGTVDSDTAESLSPGLGDAVTNFKTSNGRNPTAHEFHILSSAHPNTAGKNSNLIGTDTFLTLLDQQGYDPIQLEGLKQKLYSQGKPNLPVGLVESYMHNSNKGQLPDASLMSLVKDDPVFTAQPTPEAKADYFNKVKASFNQPGKKVIQDQNELNDVTQKTMTAYQLAVSKPDKYPNPMASVGMELSKRYDKASVNKVLLNISAANEHAKSMNQPNQPTTQPQATNGSTMGSVLRAINPFSNNNQ